MLKHFSIFVALKLNDAMITIMMTSVFNSSLGTWHILMHEKPCLIPVLEITILKIVILGCKSLVL